MSETNKPDNSIKSYTMTPEELKAYIDQLPNRPKKIKESDISITASQQGSFGGSHYRRKGGEYG